jgi:hypothetical protein
MYRKDNISWMTPVEVFKPYYGQALARFMQKALLPDEPLNMYVGELCSCLSSCSAALKLVAGMARLRAPFWTVCSVITPLCTSAPAILS